MKWSTAWAASRGVRRCKIHTCATHKTHIHPPQILTTNRTHSLLYQRHSSSFYFYYLLQLFCVNHRSIQCLMLVKCNDMYYFVLIYIRYTSQFTLHARVYFTCLDLSCNKHYMLTHGQTCSQVCMHVCAYTHTFRIGEKKRRALHLAQSLCWIDPLKFCDDPYALAVTRISEALTSQHSKWGKIGSEHYISHVEGVYILN